MRMAVIKDIRPFLMTNFDPSRIPVNASEFACPTLCCRIAKDRMVVSTGGGSPWLIRWIPCGS